MKMSNFKRIISTDYEEKDQKLIEKLGRNLNDGIDSIYFALNKKLTFDDNFLATIKEVEVTVNSSGNPINRTSLLLDTTNIVKGTLIISAVNKTNAAVFPTSTPFVSFTQSGNTLYIDNITGLQANNRYVIRIICFN
jgi:hypothetical protein